MRKSYKNNSGKNIVFLFDGTGNKPGEHKTNVVKTTELLLNSKSIQSEKNNKQEKKQIIYYDPGVGTSNSIDPYLYLKNKLVILLGKAFGYGLVKNMSEGYKFLINHFNPGDDIYFFGFSRGAFTARKLADLVAQYGLLRSNNENLFPNLLDDYFSKKDQAEPGLFWNNMCIKCEPHFIGVWDTVKSLGHIFGRRFFDKEEYSKLHSKIRYACHAVSIDERRRHFLPQLWNVNNIEGNQEIKQVYFIGCHSDVGGWYDDDEGLSHITLKWMLENAKQAGIQLNDNWEENIHPNPNGKLHLSKNLKWMWAELLDPRKWKEPNHRKISNNAQIHSSVQERLSSGPQQYNANNLPNNPNFSNHMLKDENHDE